MGMHVAWCCRGWECGGEEDGNVELKRMGIVRRV